MNSPIAAQLRGAIDSSPSQGGSPSELLQLCSGQFPTTPSPHLLPGNRKGSGTQAVRELLGLNTQVEARMELSQDTTQDDVIGFCSGAFPLSQTQHTASHASSKPSRSETSDGMSSNSSSDGEDEVGVVTDRREEGEGMLMRWAQRQQLLSQQGDDAGSKSGVGMVKSWAGYDSDDEMIMDEDMPFIRRRKVKVRQSNG